MVPAGSRFVVKPFFSQDKVSAALGRMLVANPIVAVNLVFVNLVFADSAWGLETKSLALDPLLLRQGQSGRSRPWPNVRRGLVTSGFLS
jgi:hypothetical protein